MKIALVIAISLVAAWIVFVAVLAIVKPSGIDFAAAKRLVPDTLRLLRSLSKDPSLGRGVRIRLVLLFGYLAFPIDLVPDFIPVLGYADDVIIVGLVLRSVVRAAGESAITDHWQGSPEGLALIRRLAGL